MGLHLRGLVRGTLGPPSPRSHFVTKLTPTRRHAARCQASCMGWNLNGQVPLPPCTFTSIMSWSLARGTLLGLSQSLLSGRDLFLVLVDEVCTCLGNGLFSVFFCFGYRKLHPFGRINLIITSELTFHTRTAGLYLGWHLIQRDIFPVLSAVKACHQ